MAETLEHPTHLSALAVAMAADSMRMSATHVSSGQDAIELLKMLRFDIALISSDLPDMPPWTLARTIKIHWSWTKWALIAPDASAEDFLRTCELGAIAVLDRCPSPGDFNLARGQPKASRAGPMAAPLRNSVRASRIASTDFKLLLRETRP
jgi:DNA-binding NarL/FixJ family response regulator